MTDLNKRISALRDNRDRGASAAEYALIMGPIVATLITIMALFGGSVANHFNSACTKVAGKSCI